ncbi:TlpA family protein disulfide reductase [Smaragdicoccus niigatensis]|uniref:TlpA family protein disulfide reductase n=1 Tax=Smaragdicoccus niigatensis TaxID=359359 RepID=UPI000373F3A4|nr:TlpA disulfide reductase family protein [Smaragdicoccus niigatensis]
MRQAIKWSVAILAVVGALAFALWPRTPAPTTVDEQALAPLRAAAQLSACPREIETFAPTKGPFSGLTLTCLADGQPKNVSAMLAGKPVLLNLWAYWCGPCREELPILQQYAAKAGDSITVLTVHSDPREDAALELLKSLGVHLPGLEDPDSRIAELVKAPKALPISVLIRADGSIATLVNRPFTGVDDIERTVAEELAFR